MRKLRLPPAAVAAITFVGCYGLVILIGFVLRRHFALALALVFLAVPSVAFLVMRRTRKRSDLSAKQKAALSGFLVGTGVALPLGMAMTSEPVAALFLGLPTTLLGVVADSRRYATRAEQPFLLVLLLNPYMLFALNSSVVGSLVGWMIHERKAAPAEARHAAAPWGIALALALVLGPALGLRAGLVLAGEYDSLADWSDTWHSTGNRMASNESRAVAALHTIRHAQNTYRERYGEGSYALPFSLLCCEQREIRLIDPTLAEATFRAKSGYLFANIGLDGNGKPIDPRKDFAVCAFPVRYNSTGRNTFFVTSKGTVYQRASVGSVAQLPGEHLSRWLVTSNE